MKKLTKIKLLIVVLVLLTSTAGFSQHAKSVFSHIEIIIDSASFEKLVANDFIRSSLAPFTYDTMMVSPLVLSYYLYGQNNFIHFNPARGYFETQRGTGYLIFQSLTPGQGKLLEQAFRKVANDSIVSYDFEGPDFTLTEIIYQQHSSLRKKQQNNLIPMLSSYSVKSYQKFGYGDSVEVGMQQFLAREFVKGKKLFDGITSIELEITEKELLDLAPVLELAGYRKEKNIFIKKNEPTISYVVSTKFNASKVRKLTLLLSEDAGSKSFNFGKMNLLVDGKSAVFSFE
jgi:hypothetical protein